MAGVSTLIPQITKTVALGGAALGIPQSTGNPTPTLQQTAKPAGPTLPQSSGTPTPALSPSQQSAQGWINNSASGQGGLDAYTQKQNERYAGALATGNTDLVSRLNADAQRVGYTLSNNNKISDTSTVPVNTGTPVPAFQSSNQYGQMSPSQLQDQVNARFAKLRQGVADSVATLTNGENTAYQYNNKLTSDNRNLRNATFQEDNNPFSGKYAYDKTNMLRNDNIQDTQTQTDHNNKLASYNQQLASFDTLAPEQQQAMYDQLMTQERTFGQSQDQLNMQAGQNQFNNSIAQAGQTGQWTNPQTGQTQQTQAAQNQQFNQNLALTQQQQSEANTKFAQQQQIDSVAYQKARDAISDKNYQTTFEQNIKQQGFENALKLAVQQHQISNDNAQLAISQQNATTASNNSANSNANMNQDNLMNIWKATGKAPAGIPNVATGTAYAGQDSATSVKQNTQSQYVAGFDSLPPEKRSLVFKNEKSAIIDDLGIAGYNALYNMYFDANGDPK